MEKIVIGFLLGIMSIAAYGDNVLCPPKVVCKWADPYDPMSSTCNILPFSAKFKLVTIGQRGSDGNNYFVGAKLDATSGRATCLYEGGLMADSNIGLDAVMTGGANMWGNIGGAFVCNSADMSTCLMVTRYK